LLGSAECSFNGALYELPLPLGGGLQGGSPPEGSGNSSATDLNATPLKFIQIHLSRNNNLSDQRNRF
jgi:hypothetical protein